MEHDANNSEAVKVAIPLRTIRACFWSVQYFNYRCLVFIRGKYGSIWIAFNMLQKMNASCLCHSKPSSSFTHMHNNRIWHTYTKKVPYGMRCIWNVSDILVWYAHALWIWKHYKIFNAIVRLDVGCCYWSPIIIIRAEVGAKAQSTDDTMVIHRAENANATGKMWTLNNNAIHWRNLGGLALKTVNQQNSRSRLRCVKMVGKRRKMGKSTKKKKIGQVWRSM